MTERPYIRPIPLSAGTNEAWLREAARAVGTLITRANAVTEVTLTANAESTTLYHPTLGYYTHVSLMPQTANAAAEIGAGTIYIAQATMKKGECVITHANNAQTDRTFRVKIDG
jgi:hypothetical protein